jgi:hypothetical protein
MSYSPPSTAAARFLGSAIGAVVIDEDRFPRHALERSVETRDHGRDVGALAVGWENDGKL